MRVCFFKIFIIYFSKVGAIDPGTYRQIEELAREHTKGKARVEILNVKNVEGGDQEL